MVFDEQKQSRHTKTNMSGELLRIAGPVKAAQLLFCRLVAGANG
jgi:hypothetical protein